MTFLDDVADATGLGDTAEPLRVRLRAFQERVRQVLARQAGLLTRLETLLHDANASKPEVSSEGPRWLCELREQQASWQQRQDEYWQRQQGMFEALFDQIGDLVDTVQHAGSTPAPAAKTSDSSSSSLNWEQAKQRLLAELENTSDVAQSQPEATRRGSSKSRRDWQALLAEKDAEILQLRSQLEQLVAQPPIDVLPAAVSDDELIIRERDNLHRLQEEWQEKLRRAEIEISLERAQLARERAQMEDKQANPPQPKPTSGSTVAGEPNKAPRSRWMARLGLLDE